MDNERKDIGAKPYGADPVSVPGGKDMTSRYYRRLLSFKDVCDKKPSMLGCVFGVLMNPFKSAVRGVGLEIKQEFKDTDLETKSGLRTDLKDLEPQEPKEP